MKKTLLAFIAFVALCLISCEEKRTAAPTGFEARQVGNAIELSWNRVYEADEYCIENTSTGMSEYTSSTSFIDKNPIEGANNYELRACGSAYGWSASVYVSCNFNSAAGGDDNGGGDDGGGSGTLPAPKGFTLSQTDTYVKLSWNAVSGAYGYLLGKAEPSDDEYKYLAETTSTTYLDYEVSSGTTYYYIIYGDDAEGNVGGYSEKSITFTGDSGGGDNPGGGGDNPGGGGSSKPNTPSGLKASVSSSCIELTWNSVSNADYYNIYRCGEANGSYAYLTSTNSSYYTDCNVISGVTYYYKVSAENNNGESSLSSYVYGKVTSSGGGGGGGDGGGGGGATKPSAPTGLKATSQSSYIELTWNSVSDAVKYYIYRSTSSSGSYSLLDESYTTSYQDKVVSAGTTYYYKVSAVNYAGEGSKSSYAYCKYEGPALAPCDPKGVQVSQGYSSVTIKWEVSSGSGCGKPTKQTISFYNIKTGGWVDKSPSTTSYGSSSYQLTSTYLNEYTNGGYLLMFIITLENAQGKVSWLFEYDLDKDAITHYEQVD